MQEPKKNERLFRLFEEICRIPRQTGDEAAISNYLMEFARIRGFRAEQDSHYNVLIRKPASIPSYVGPTVILQGHMDMVYEKTPESIHRYEDGIHVVEENGYLKSAAQTTLGADNGVALAYGLDLLERKDLPLPPLEILITTGEEAGLDGVKNLELTDVKGSYLINLDAEEEGVFLTSCAGGLRTDLLLPLEYETRNEEVSVSLSLKGLRGGHSGLDIGLGRANAIKLLGRILLHTAPLARISFLESQGKANAIASTGTIYFHTSKKENKLLLKELSRLEKEMSLQFADTDNLSFVINEREEVHEENVFTEKTLKAITQAINLLPNGVISRMRENETMVQTSSNIGSLTIHGSELTILCSGRSSKKIEKEQLREHMQVLAETLGIRVIFHGDYPQWEYRKESKLQKICKKVYWECTGKEAVFTGIHAGIECGYLSEKLGSHIDMISCGANLFDVHTPGERADAMSFYRMEEILIEIIKEIARSGNHL